MSSQPVSSRRRFFGHAGAALSAPLAIAASLAAEGHAEPAGDLAARVAALEAANAIRALQETYARLVNAGSREALAQLFVDPAHALDDGDIRGLTFDPLGDDDVIAVVTDGTATARRHCTVETATPIGPSCTLVEMARLQGDGVVKHTLQRVLDSAYVQQDRVWKIARATYRPV